MSIDEAAELFKNSIDAFVADYKKKSAENPEHYPLSFSNDNAGLWSEFIVDFHNNH